jgi:hypothetical protein
MKGAGISGLEYYFSHVGLSYVGDDWLKVADKYPVVPYLVKTPYRVVTEIYANFNLRKPYREWHVYEVSIIWDGGSRVLLNDESFFIDERHYEYKEGLYLRFWDFANINFEKIFKGKRHGDQFPVKMLMRYSFDNETEVKQEFEFMVLTTRWKFVDIWSP